MKSVLYRVYYEEQGEKVNVLSVCKAGIFEDRSTAFIAKESLNDYEKEKEKQAPGYVKACYGVADISGRWSEQQEALYRAAKNGGLFMIR